MNKWKLSYMPGSREVKFEGTKEELDKYFEKHLICNLCKKELQMGKAGILDEEYGDMYPKDALDTPCSYEWMIEEIKE